MIRQLVREMLLQEVNLYDLLGRKPAYPEDIELDSAAGGGVKYPERKSTAEVRRDTKRQWNEWADHSYFQDPKKLFIYHILGEYSGKMSLEDYFPIGASVPGKVAGIDIPSKNEISCYGRSAALGGLQSVRSARSFFTFKKYRVTFASTHDADTERLSMATSAHIEKYWSSGLPKRPSVSVQRMTIPLDEEEVMKNGGKLDEVVIDNWIIDTFYCEKGDVDYAKELGLKYKVLGT